MNKKSPGHQAFSTSYFARTCQWMLLFSFQIWPVSWRRFKEHLNSLFVTVLLVNRFWFTKQFLVSLGEGFGIEIVVLCLFRSEKLAVGFGLEWIRPGRRKCYYIQYYCSNIQWLQRDTDTCMIKQTHHWGPSGFIFIFHVWHRNRALLSISRSVLHIV